MDTGVISNVANNSYIPNTKNTEKKTEEVAAKKTGFDETAAVYEASDKSNNVKAKNTTGSAYVAQAKEALAQQQQHLIDIVMKTIQGQGKTIGQSDDIWKMLANGDFEVDADTKAAATEAISENGYWGVNQTSDRILDFAKALAGNDPEKADAMLDAFKKGFKEATKAWGKTLPDISQKTYDAVLEKFDAWKNQTEAV